jgi:hypothetical protein
MLAVVATKRGIHPQLLLPASPLASLCLVITAKVEEVRHRNRTRVSEREGRREGRRGGGSGGREGIGKRPKPSTATQRAYRPRPLPPSPFPPNVLTPAAFPVPDPPAWFELSFLSLSFFLGVLGAAIAELDRSSMVLPEALLVVCC